MKDPLLHRGNIPFYHKKTEAEFKQDAYERYDDMVVRQSLLHLADELWGSYPMQGVLDFAQAYYPEIQGGKILEIGCGVGRWIADLAMQFPGSECFGMDYSYQMLKRAHEFWVQGKEIEIRAERFGFLGNQSFKGKTIGNLHFGLAKAEALPFEDSSVDLICHSFLIDRLDEPIEGIREMRRVLKPQGKVIMVSPFNFSKGKNWKRFYPLEKFKALLEESGFEIIEVQEGISVHEPLDIHGNHISWNCVGLVATG